jgi:hypothetical protein
MDVDRVPAHAQLGRAHNQYRPVTPPRLPAGRCRGPAMAALAISVVRGRCTMPKYPP